MSQTKLIKCECKHEYQDQKYGKGIRLANKTKFVHVENEVYRCTVCKREK